MHRRGAPWTVIPQGHHLVPRQDTDLGPRPHPPHHTAKGNCQSGGLTAQSWELTERTGGEAVHIVAPLSPANRNHSFHCSLTPQSLQPQVRAGSSHLCFRSETHRLRRPHRPVCEVASAGRKGPLALLQTGGGESFAQGHAWPRRGAPPSLHLGLCCHPRTRGQRPLGLCSSSRV